MKYLLNHHNFVHGKNKFVFSTIEILPEVTAVVQKLENFEESQFIDLASRNEFKYSELMKSIRICLTGSKVSLLLTSGIPKELSHFSQKCPEKCLSST